MRSKLILRYFAFVSFFAISIMSFSSCSNDDEIINTPETPGVLQLKDNVKIIDANKLQLDLSPSQLDNGIYKFSFTGAAPSIAVGDVIVGEHGEGFIRKVSTSTINGNVIVLQTTQGRMSDVFKEGEFSFNLDMSDMHNKSSSNGFSYTVTNRPIYQQGALSIVLDNAQIDFNPNWFFDFNFNKKGITDFEMSTKNGTLNGNFTATVTASQAISLISQSSSIVEVEKSYTKWVPATLFGLPVSVPVTVVMQLDLVLDYSATMNVAISRQATFTSNNMFNLGVNYADGQWNDINSFTPTNNFTLSKRSGNGNFTINLALTPKVSFKLYGQAGPYASVGLMEELSGTVASPSLDWDIKADVWLKSTAGASVSILDYELSDYSKTWETSKLSYFTPHKIEKVSGDNQKGTLGKQLADPLKIKIVDNFNKPQENVPVYFIVGSGGGKVQINSILTDANGIAETLWVLGTSGPQSVTVYAKKGNGSSILNSPVTFSATSECDPTTTTLAISVSTTSNSAAATVTGGQSPYTYLWSNGSTNATATNLSNGTYTVIVTDAFGCTKTGSATVGVDNLLGTWKLESYNGVALGECDPNGPNGVGYCWRVFSDVITITETTFSNYNNSNETELATGIVTNTSGSITGSRNGLIMTFTDTDGFVNNVTITVISISLGKISINGFVYVKQ